MHEIQSLELLLLLHVNSKKKEDKCVLLLPVLNAAEL